MNQPKISDAVLYIGVDDKTIDLFESQYRVPNGVSYNSYLILDDKVAVMDTVDRRATDAWFDNLDRARGGREVDYLIVSHLEPDHAANIQALCEKFPKMQVVSNPKVFSMLPQFFSIDFSQRAVVVKEGDTLQLGSHTLQFFMAPMVHWPEVMVSYEQKEKILFSADGFGKFGALDTDEPWADEARRYYINIVGKYGPQVQALLKKAAGLDIKTICPLHGPILQEDLGYYLDLYQTWSTYTPEEEGIVIAFASIHGNTAAAARTFAQILGDKGAKTVEVYDLSRCDMAQAVSQAFRYDRLVVMASSYDAGVFPPMEDFLCHLRNKTFRSRKVGVVENGSWAPSAGKVMMGYLTAMKDLTICPTMPSIRSTLKGDSLAALEQLAKELLEV